MYSGQKVLLRAYKKEDVPIAQEYLNDMEVRRFLQPGIPYPYTLEDEYKWYEQQSASGDIYSFAIECLETGRYIGGCGVNQMDWKNRVCTIGIFIGDKNYWNKGYGMDAMYLLKQFVFDQMNVHKIRLDVYSFNGRAIALYEKAGFKKEGVFREEIFRDGTYYDVIRMGILRSENLGF
ncbi:MAG: hypothetical protein PWQ12_180 [Clostridiales bacterium]|nr:hypothetical protein [Clostridiales bacterium]